MADVGKAMRFKEDGNRHYKDQNYNVAESLYTKAINADDTNPALYTNRAMARMKLGLWDLVLKDCEKALQLDSQNMKAFYQISQAYLNTGNYNLAVESAIRAKELAIGHNDRSLPNILDQLRKSLKERWEDREKSKANEISKLEQKTVSLYEEHKEAALQGCVIAEQHAKVTEEWDRDICHVREIFEKARPQGEKRRDPPPDWLLCDISFQVMIDPVVTKAGHSYDRQCIMQHLQKHPYDPYTREPLYPRDLKPNLALKKACDAYLVENGWAAEY